MADVAVRVEGLSKHYTIGGHVRYKTLRDTFASVSRIPFRRLSSLADHSAKHEQTRRNHDSRFWALKDISFQIAPGEIMGVIGRNGAGKSTLLKILSRITEPAEGYAEIHGRVGALLEVGTGFHQELSGRENVYLNGAILGMKKAEIRRKFDEIVAFAEIEQFIDTPVKHYSSGMRVRLAFAVAAHLQAEILIVDEVLAVGDAQFQAKCLDTMKDVVRSGRTVFFVSHNIAAIQSLCSRALLLHQGKLLCDRTVEICLQQYAAIGPYHKDRWQREEEDPDRELLIHSIALALQGQQPRHILLVDLQLTSHHQHRPAFISIDILDAVGAVVMQALPTVEGFITDTQSRHGIRLTIQLPPLIPGRYLVTVWVGSHQTKTYDEVRESVAFEIQQSPTENRTYPHTSRHGYIVPETTIDYHQEPTVGSGE
ncbi:MAG TPA: ABC transporter ATP-binding protein [Chloroflexota bacterium]|nr:ABC transporter ATP-binding protein [Chloroflexota bacterium]